MKFKILTILLFFSGVAIGQVRPNQIKDASDSGDRATILMSDPSTGEFDYQASGVVLPYSAASTYSVNDLVSFGGYIYRSQANSNVSTPGVANWEIITGTPATLDSVVIAEDSIIRNYYNGSIITADTIRLLGVGTGDVVGPASSTDNAIARFDATTGKIIQNSLVTIDDSGNIALPGSVDGRFIAEDGEILDDHADTLIVHDNRIVALEQNANEVEDSLAQHRADIDSKGDLSGPASSLDNRIATFDGTTGKLIQQSGISIDGTNITAVSPISILDSNYLSSFARIYMNYDSPLAILNGYDMEQGWHFYNSEEDINWYLGANYEGVYFQGEAGLVTYFPSYDFERDSLRFIIDATGHFFESTKAIPLPPRVRGYGETALNNYQDGDYEHVLQYNDVLAPIGAVRLLDTVTVLSNDTVFYKVLGQTVGFDVLPAGSGSDDGVVDGGSIGDILQELTLTRTVGADVDIDISGLVFESELTTNTGAIATQIEAEEGSVTTVRRFTPERIAQAVGALETSLAHILPLADYTVFAAGHDFRILTAGDIALQGTGNISFGDGINTFYQFSNSTGSVNFTPPTSIIMNTPLVQFQNNISETYRVTFDNMRLEEIAPGYEGQDAINKNQFDSIVTKIQTFGDSTSLTVNLAGVRQTIVEWDMTGVSNAGTITLQEPLNAFGSTTDAGLYTFVIFDCNTHNFDFPASFRDMGGSTAYDASSTVEIVDFSSFTCYYNGTIYRCK